MPSVRHITSANTSPLKSKSLSQKAILYNKRLTTTKWMHIKQQRNIKHTLRDYSIPKHRWNDTNKEMYLWIDQLWPLNGKNSLNNILKETPQQFTQLQYTKPTELFKHIKTNHSLQPSGHLHQQSKRSMVECQIKVKSSAFFT